MALNYTPRCIRCRKKMRNDGTTENPKWVCNNRNCVRYVPPSDGENTNDEQTEEETK